MPSVCVYVCVCPKCRKKLITCNPRTDWAIGLKFVLLGELLQRSVNDLAESTKFLFQLWNIFTGCALVTSPEIQPLQTPLAPLVTYCHNNIPPSLCKSDVTNIYSIYHANLAFGILVTRFIFWILVFGFWISFFGFLILVFGFLILIFGV